MISTKMVEATRFRCVRRAEPGRCGRRSAVGSVGGGNLKLFVFGCLVLLLVGHWHGVAFGGLVVGLVCCLVISLVVGFLVCVAFFCFGLEQFSRLWHLQNHSDDWAVGSSMGELPLAVRPWAAFWLDLQPFTCWEENVCH